MDDIFWTTLTFVKGLGNVGINKLYKQNRFANFKTLSDQSFTKLVSKSVQEQLIDYRYMEGLKKEAISHIETHKRKEISVISINSDYYPFLLRLVKDAPAIFYAKGNLQLLKRHLNIAIVGTRNPTSIGVYSAKKIASTFAQRGYTIVSGLAKGIDTAAHQGALHIEGGKTIAVLAGGLSKIYPSENKQLANDILIKNGLLISEDPIGKANIKGNFVKRDRIQSGLSIGICPVQTPIQGGTQHTIQYARKQHRFLFTPIPLENDESAVQGNKELIASGMPVLHSQECYDKFEEEMKKTYQLLTEKIDSYSQKKIFKHNEEDRYEQGSLF